MSGHFSHWTSTTVPAPPAAVSACPKYWVAGSVPTTYRTTLPVAAALTGSPTDRAPPDTTRCTPPLETAMMSPVAASVVATPTTGTDVAAAVTVTCPAADRYTSWPPAMAAAAW